MSFDLNTVVPWGRLLDEYRAMFSLCEEELKNCRILDCGGGPSSFNAELTKEGGRVFSVDPLYEAGRADIKKRIEETFESVMEQTLGNRTNFVWDNIKDPEELGRVRMNAMSKFLEDYDTGKEQGRYVAASVVGLSFADNSFALALSSHFLFLYTQQLSLDFHIAAITEMCRVAGEVRIFPLVDMQCKKSQYLEPVIAVLKDKGFNVETVRVPYEFQKDANEMLRIG